jgi:hypothetical protein
MEQRIYSCCQTRQRKGIEMTSKADRSAITADSLKRWGCRDWSNEEREELARIANMQGLVEPSTGVWLELADAFRDYLG